MSPKRNFASPGYIGQHKIIVANIPIKKTFRERWFSWPWKPWESHKLMTRHIDRLRDGYIIMSQEAFDEFVKHDR